VNNPSKKDRAPYQVTLNGVVGLLADNLRCDPVRGCASHHAKSSVVMGSFCIHLTGPRNLRILARWRPLTCQGKFREPPSGVGPRISTPTVCQHASITCREPMRLHSRERPNAPPAAPSHSQDGSQPGGH
jgi:hypothetical protein